ncbi:MAG: dihydrofolate reductase [bacterium]
MTISIIVVIGKNREIGFQNRLLWDLPRDMEHFKKATTGHTVIMGSKTYESIGNPLPERTNVVIAIEKDYEAEGCLVTHSIEEALETAKREEKNGEIFIIGGASIYKQMLPYADKLYLTIVNDAPEADTFFPDYSEFKNIVSEQETEDQNLKLKFLELTK